MPEFYYSYKKTIIQIWDMSGIQMVQTGWVDKWSRFWLQLKFETGQNGGLLEF